MPRIPDLPGFLVESGSEYAQWLKKAVSELCNLNNKSDRLVPSLLRALANPPFPIRHSYSRFPGAQPVSFTMLDIQKLIDEESVPAHHFLSIRRPP